MMTTRFRYKLISLANLDSAEFPRQLRRFAGLGLSNEATFLLLRGNTGTVEAILLSEILCQDASVSPFAADNEGVLREPNGNWFLIVSKLKVLP